MSPRPSEHFAGILRFIRFINRCVGVDCYDPNFRFNVITAITTVAIMVYISCTIFTVSQEYKDNWMNVVQALAMGGSVIQGVNKMCVGLFSSQKVSELAQQIMQIYETFEQDSDPRYAEVLLHNCKKLRRTLLIIGLGYVIGVICMITIPLVATEITGNLYLVTHFHIPGVDLHTPTGARVTQITQAVWLTIGALGLFAGDMLFILNMLQSFVYADVLRLKVDELNMHVQTTSINKDPLQSAHMLVGIAKWHQTYLEFVAECNKLFYVMVSVQIASSAVCIVMTIFALLTSNWIAGIPYISVIIPNMYLYCILGTMLETCNDSIMYEMYNISFYHLGASHQRFVVFMLAKSQQPDVIQLLGVMPLAVSTALQISKSIYSITMMMVKFLIK